MLDFLYSVGQAMSVLLMLYGAFLVAGQWLPAKMPVAPKLEDKLLLLKRVRTDP